YTTLFRSPKERRPPRQLDEALGGFDDAPFLVHDGGAPGERLDRGDGAANAFGVPDHHQIERGRRVRADPFELGDLHLRDVTVTVVPEHAEKHAASLVLDELAADVPV